MWNLKKIELTETEKKSDFQGLEAGGNRQNLGKEYALSKIR